MEIVLQKKVKIKINKIKDINKCLDGHNQNGIFKLIGTTYGIEQYGSKHGIEKYNDYAHENVLKREYSGKQYYRYPIEVNNENDIKTLWFFTREYEDCNVNSRNELLVVVSKRDFKLSKPEYRYKFSEEIKFEVLKGVRKFLHEINLIRRGFCFDVSIEIREENGTKNYLFIDNIITDSPEELKQIILNKSKLEEEYLNEINFTQYFYCVPA